jgi:transcriptional regulator with XRE-family HTH domain
MMTIGTKIKNLRDSKKMSQVELAMKLGIGQTTLGSIESGETKKIDFLLMDKICKEFDVDSDYFKDPMKLKQINNDNAIGYIENQVINNLSEKLIEQYEERIKELKQRIFELENK